MISRMIFRQTFITIGIFLEINDWTNFEYIHVSKREGNSIYEQENFLYDENFVSCKVIVEQVLQKRHYNEKCGMHRVHYKEAEVI